MSEAALSTAIGLDLGGTTLTGLLVDATGRILARERRDTPRGRPPEDVLNLMRETAAALIDQAKGLGPAPVGLGPSPVGIGLGVPGPVHAERGISLFSPNLGWRDVDVAGYFHRAFGLPVRVDNDVRVAALGEGWTGAARTFQTYVLLTIGTGIGSGVVLDGRLWRGPGFSAGEIGHIPVRTDPEAPECGCSRRGCLETLASGRAIARDGTAAAARAESPRLAAILNEKGRVSAHDVAEAARAGDGVARRIFDEATDYLASGVATIINLFNPEAVIIGGGVAGAWDLIEPVLSRQVARRAFPPNLAFLKGILPATLGEDAGAVGAAAQILAPTDGAGGDPRGPHQCS